MIQETDEDRADRERMLDALERGFWHRHGKQLFARDNDRRPKGRDTK